MNRLTHCWIWFLFLIWTGLPCRGQSADEPPLYTYRVVKAYPHDPKAFTQGLAYANGVLYEGTGQYGKSVLRKVDLESGAVLQEHRLESRYFGEGIAVVGDTIFQLTWQNQTGFVYDKTTFQPQRTFAYSTEGWGLAYDGRELILSDGTEKLYFADTKDFRIARTVRVTDRDRAVNRLNELECVEGEVWANIWFSDRIARINPQTGTVLGWIDLQGLLPDEERLPETNVLNGIAYDTIQKKIFVTGKNWPKLYEITLIPKPTGPSRQSDWHLHPSD